MKAFMLAILLACVSAVSAQTNEVFLPKAAKAQTGTYQVIREDELEPRVRTGAALEVFDVGERLLSTGGTNENPFLFGTLYSPDGSYYTLAGDIGGTHVFADVFTNGDDGVAQVGTAWLVFDPKENGDAHSVWFLIALDEGNLYLGRDTVFGTYVRMSDIQINACRLKMQFSPADPRNIEPCLPQ